MTRALETFLREHVTDASRRAAVAEVADGLVDLRNAERIDLEDVLKISEWPAFARNRFLQAWQGLRDAGRAAAATADNADMSCSKRWRLCLPRLRRRRRCCRYRGGFRSPECHRRGSTSSSSTRRRGRSRAMSCRAAFARSSCSRRKYIRWCRPTNASARRPPPSRRTPCAVI